MCGTCALYSLISEAKGQGFYLSENMVYFSVLALYGKSSRYIIPKVLFMYSMDKQNEHHRNSRQIKKETQRNKNMLQRKEGFVE